MNTLYIDLSIYNCDLRLTKTKKDYKHALKYLGETGDYPLSIGQAFHKDEEGSLHQVMFIDLELCKKRKLLPFEIVGLIAHEVSHVVLDIWTHINEKEIAHEANAYLTQNILIKALQFYMPQLCKE